jgi:hypothetical protein
MSLIPIHQHCETFLNDGINPMIGLGKHSHAMQNLWIIANNSLLIEAHAVANYAENATVFLEELKKQMDIICDRKIPTRSDEAMETKMMAKEILAALQEEAKDTNEKILKITEAINLVRTCRMSFLQGIAVRVLTNNSALV